MIIVSGHLIVDADARAAYLDECLEVVRQARAADGCVDFHLSADPLESDRINVFEQWTSREAVEAFRGTGPSEQQQATIERAEVHEHEIVSSRRL